MWGKKFHRADMGRVYEPMVLGVTACCPGCGATHFAIALGNYYSGFYQKRTAVLEWNQSGDLERMQRSLGIKGEKEFFVYRGIHFYKGVLPETFLQIQDQGYECMVLDFGRDREQNYREWSRCQRLVSMVSLTAWKRSSFLELLNNEEERLLQTITYLYVFGEAKARGLSLPRGLSLHRLPFFASPFLLEGESFAFFNRSFAL